MKILVPVKRVVDKDIKIASRRTAQASSSPT
jgi:hypothetical protein